MQHDFLFYFKLKKSQGIDLFYRTLFTILYYQTPLSMNQKQIELFPGKTNILRFGLLKLSTIQCLSNYLLG